MKEKLLNRIRNNWYAASYMGIMAIIYIIMMFCNKPWYDELYTYYSFISRGPIYAAIHWPVPNNHVGYSVISGFFNIFGNSYLSLRGVSCIAAVANLYLIYRLGCHIMKKKYAFLAMVMYSGANMIHMLAVQGRGYTLAITCYLLALFAAYKICLEGSSKKYYIMFAISLTYGLYILPSSIYWVLPLCISNGLFLLIKKDWKRLLGLVASAMLAAIAAMGLYAIIWLAIGSNLLCKNPETSFYGLSHVKTILSAPVTAAKTGIDYMLATPYIQSIDRKTAVLGLPGYFEEFFSQCYSYFGICLCIVMVFLIVFYIYYSILEVRYRRKGLWVGSIISSSLFMTLLILIIQSVHPYKRVLSFIMVPLAIGMSYAIYRWFEYNGMDEKKVAKCELWLIVIITILIGFRLMSYDYRRPLADRENDIEEALKLVDVNDIDTIYYTDDYQKYVLKFYHDAEPVETSVEEARYVLICSEILTPQYTENVWPVLMPNDQPFLKYISDNFDELASTEKYTVYCRK